MPDKAETLGRVNDLFRELFDDDDIVVSETTTAKEVEGWDSLAHISVILAVEREFRIKLAAAEVGSLKNVGQMIDLIMARAA